MDTEKKGHIALIVAIAVPIIVIVALAAAIYLPGKTKNTAYDFVYAMSAGDRVLVKDGKITSIVSIRPDPYAPKYIDRETGAEVAPVLPLLYRYRVADDTSVLISLEEAKLLSVSDNPTSPDGFSIVDGNGSGGFFPFFYDGDSYGTKYLKSGLSAKKLNVQSYQSSPYEYRSFMFVGWVLK